MKKKVYYILILFICSNCSKENIQWTSKRETTTHYGGKPKKEIFILSFLKKGDTLQYEYISEIDSAKTVLIKTIKNSNSLSFGGTKFINSDRELFSNQKLNNFEFDYYNLEYPVTDGTGPILFNEQYGLLAINNVFGPTIIFLEKMDDDLTELIISELNK
tara:strand:+ start:5376 stop:5855 length:480 start_codon:yes stop_codon:yes gene_type:complete